VLHIIGIEKSPPEAFSRVEKRLWGGYMLKNDALQLIVDEESRDI
jgi:hypothetical protein